MRVSFTTKSGEQVSFNAKKKGSKNKRPANAYAKFVGEKIGKHLAQGKSAPQAMRAVAREWRAR